MHWNRTGVAAAVIAGCAAVTAAPADAAGSDDPRFAAYEFGSSAAWLKEIALPIGLMSRMDGGSGITIGFVDTGVRSDFVEFDGHISSLSGCAGIIIKCTTPEDANGHGTATAAIAAGFNAVGSAGMSGVAPGATILVEKSLSDGGVATDLDVANGISRAADAGADIINLSVSYTPTARVVGAIDYAASKGIYVVYAGGNESSPLNAGNDTTGLSDAALSHLLFVGSVDASRNLSAFSNTPGTGSAVSDTASVGYSRLWLMAPGEGILTPGLDGTPVSWSGTSMAAPIVSGALALMIKRWPILVHDGTAAQVLFQTATDLGEPGYDSTYGWGLLNVRAAFRAIDPVTVIDSSGMHVALTSLAATLVSGGPLAVVSARTQKALSRYPVFDAFDRDFRMNLSSLVQVTGVPARIAPQLGPVVHASAASFAGGASAGFLYTTDAGYVAVSDPSMLSGADRARSSHQIAAWQANLSGGAAGVTLALSNGFSGEVDYAQSLWGRSTLPIEVSGGAQSLLGFASGGLAAAFGASLDDDTRIAIGWSSSALQTRPSGFVPPQSKADAAGAGLSRRVGDAVTLAASLEYLREDQALLGGSYSSGSFALPHGNGTASLGVSSAIRLRKGTELVFDATFARTNGAKLDGSFLTAMTPLLARSYGVAWVEQDVLSRSDELSIAVRRPLRVTGGSIGLLTASVDAEGLPVSETQSIPFAPLGKETDLSVSYAALFEDGMALQASTGISLDAGNMPGATGGFGRLELTAAL